MELVDSHCHVQDTAFDDDREDVIERSLAQLSWLLLIGDDVPTSRDAVALTRDRVYAAVGVHPYHADTLNDDSLEELTRMARNDHVVAIGEIGLDYFKYNETPRDVQQDAFRKQLELAATLDLPVVIHNRESYDDLGAMLDEYHEQLCGGVMHCFAGDEAFLERCLGWGFYISFAGNVTFPKAKELHTAADRVPVDRLLVETDSPYLAPQPVRGKRCEPGYVEHTARFLAERKKMDAEALAEITAQNAARLFRIS